MTPPARKAVCWSEEVEMGETPCPWGVKPLLGLIFCSQEMSRYPVWSFKKQALSTCHVPGIVRGTGIQR